MLQSLLRPDRPRTARARCALLALALIAVLATSATGAPPPAPADDVPPEAVLADLAMLATPGAPRIAIDLAPPGTKPFPAVLDTGIIASLASDAVLARIGATKLPERGRAFERPTALGRPLAVFRPMMGDAALANEDAVRFGGAFLRGVIVELDFERRRVRFLDPERYAIPERDDRLGRAVLPIHDYAARPRVAIELNGQPVEVFLDTTVAAPLWLDTRDVAKAAIDPRPLPVVREARRRGSRVRFFPTDAVKLGPFDLGLVPALVGGMGQVDEFGGSGAAIGLDLLSQFKVRLDIANHRLWLERRSSERLGFGGIPFAHTQAAGALLGPLGKLWTVIGVLPDTPAAKAGLQGGDRIDPSELGNSDLAHVLDAIRTGEVIEVRRPTGDGTGEERMRLSAPPISSGSPRAPSADGA